MTQAKQADGAPLYLYSHGRSYNHNWSGPESVVEGLRPVHRDWKKTVTFLVADHHTKGDQVYHRAVVGIALIDGEPRWRWCGERDQPDGPSSSSICDFEPEDFELAIAIVVADLARVQGQHPSTLIYRERLDTDL